MGKGRNRIREWWKVVLVHILANLLTVHGGMTQMKGADVWQLCNVCSKGCMHWDNDTRRFLSNGTLNDSDCRTDFFVHSADFGVVRIQHAMSKRFVCFNRRGRLYSTERGFGSGCAFKEHMDESGFTKLESSRVELPHTYLGFNRKGKFLSKSTARRNQEHCFRFTKFERRISDSERRVCCARDKRCRVDRDVTKEEEKGPRDNDFQRHLHNVVRNSILNDVRATSNDLLLPIPPTVDPPTTRPVLSADRFLDSLRASRSWERSPSSSYSSSSTLHSEENDDSSNQEYLYRVRKR